MTSVITPDRAEGPPFQQIRRVVLGFTLASAAILVFSLNQFRRRTFALQSKGAVVLAVISAVLLAALLWQSNASWDVADW